MAIETLGYTLHMIKIKFNYHNKINNKGLTEKQQLYLA